MHTYSIPLGPERLSVKVYCPADAFNCGTYSWSLRPLSVQGNDPALRKPLLEALAKAWQGSGVRHVYAPKVDAMSAAIIEPKDLTEEISVDSEIRLYRNSYLPADGVFLPRGRASAMSAAGCAQVLAAVDGEVISVHASRDSLIDRGAVMGTPTREEVSVVGSIVRAFEARGYSPSEIAMVMLFAIPKEMFEHRFDHPIHGEYNLALHRFIAKSWRNCSSVSALGMHLDLEALFVEQARSFGVTQAWTALSLSELPNLAHTRDGKSPDRRNLVFVKRE